MVDLDHTLVDELGCKRPKPAAGHAALLGQLGQADGHLTALHVGANAVDLLRPIFPARLQQERRPKAERVELLEVGVIERPAPELHPAAIHGLSPDFMRSDCGKEEPGSSLRESISPAQSPKPSLPLSGSGSHQALP